MTIGGAGGGFDKCESTITTGVRWTYTGTCVTWDLEMATRIKGFGSMGMQVTAWASEDWVAFALALLIAKPAVLSDSETAKRFCAAVTETCCLGRGVGEDDDRGRFWQRTCTEHSLIVCLLPSPVATGGLSWAQPPQTKLRAPPKLKYETLQISRFLSNLNVKPPLYERKASPHKGKAPLLTTFWRRFCFCLLALHLSNILYWVQAVATS